ncbi:MAG: histidine kinase [Clostridiales bacterium]|nr:histidine kinase [Clostridiales bacterium]
MFDRAQRLILFLPLRLEGSSLYSRTDITYLSSDANTILFTAVVVILTSLTAALLLAVLLGGIITKPLNRLTRRLRIIGGNDFSRDPAIETGGGEIAEVGRVVNDMAGSIKKLLLETEEMYIKQKNSEIALLQSQVNPHFLYNTLDTVRWMAVIQKNPGIEKTVRSLSNLLKNLAKGAGDKITIGEELSLLKDYIDTQSVRFMELLEFEENIPESLRRFLIVKFTLQPLVENAIFHGIEPKGELGKITVSAEEDGEYLLIFVEDNGAGMTAGELDRVARATPHPAGSPALEPPT